MIEAVLFFFFFLRSETEREQEGENDMYSIISNKAVCFLLYFYSATDKLR